MIQPPMPIVFVCWLIGSGRAVSVKNGLQDLWLKDVAPSSDLRAWFGHQPERFAEFRQKYETELAEYAVLATLEKLAGEHKTLTLLYGAKEPSQNYALVVQSFIEHQLKH